MKRSTVLFSLVLAILAVSPALSHASAAVPSANYAVSTLSGPLVSPGIYMAGGMAYGATDTIQQAPPDAPKLDVDVKVDRTERRWAISPVWMAIGGLALLLLIALIVMGSRGEGGGTTVVRG